jgi:hypothetical protein
MIQIRYYLSLPASVPLEQVNETITKLHSYCFDKPFHSVSNIETIDHEQLQRPAEVARFQAQYPGIKPSKRIGFSCGLGENDHSKEFGVYLFGYPAFKKIKVPWFFDNSTWLDPQTPEPLFLTRYAAIMATLNYANELGIEVRVKDEGGYWESKSRAKLIEMKHILDKHPDPRDFCLTVR